MKMKICFDNIFISFNNVPRNGIPNLEGIHSHNTILASDTSCIWGSPKPPSVTIIHKKDSQSLWNAIILMVKIYNREKKQIKISQIQRCIGQNPGGVQTYGFQLSFLSGVIESVNFYQLQCDDTHEIFQPERPTEPQCPDFLLGLITYCPYA